MTSHLPVKHHIVGKKWREDVFDYPDRKPQHEKNDWAKHNLKREQRLYIEDHGIQKSTKEKRKTFAFSYKTIAFPRETLHLLAKAIKYGFHPT